MRALYFNGKLIVAGGCPFCGGSLSVNYVCQRPSCRTDWINLEKVESAYQYVEELATAIACLDCKKDTP